MAWDPCLHLLKTIIINAERECQRLEGKPRDRNITNLYSEGCIRFGVAPVIGLSTERAHLPTPEESAKDNPDSPWVFACPICHEKSYVLQKICKECKDSEGGKYKTKFVCYKCKHMEKSEKYLVQWAKELNIELKSGMIREMGIKTITDKGLK